MSKRGKSLPSRAESLMRVLRVHLPDLRQRYGVREMRVFGSCTRGEDSDRSDVDIVVDFERTPSLLTFVDLENELAAMLGARVDLVMRDSLKPAIGERILAEAVRV